ncbi:hypothetical protein [Mycobacterium paragordonae]|uniref:Uncharacterized protein n=1 Tax=Mycobacterium paragordonae TaxID=1389713 RepID=A0AAJ1RZI8_9MYCO|nr:hypothetical protein [Mycobacterium paragordonae]MDP7733645.1 hypothetical protein [Mycobacterium paragordonae]
MINFQLRLFGLDLLQLFAATEEADCGQYGTAGGEFELCGVVDPEDTEQFGFQA